MAAELNAPDEPRGRWEDRCTYVWIIDRAAYLNRTRIMVCDRPNGHAGLHTGRIFSFGLGTGEATSVIGYARRPR